jgi:hypothetical protein
VRMPQVGSDRRQFSAMGAWPTPPPSAMEATRIGFWLETPQVQSGSADFGRCWPLARCSVPRSFLILNEERENRLRCALSARKLCSGAKI